MTESADPEGLRVFYYLVQDLKALVFSLISLHFKVRAILLRSRGICTNKPIDQAHLEKFRDALGVVQDLELGGKGCFYKSLANWHHVTSISGLSSMKMGQIDASIC